jgi:DNA-binding MarR family transcriptional regulator
LGDLLYLESNTLTPMLKRMESAGLVERRRDLADERVVRIRLSPQGRSVASELDCVQGDMLMATGDKAATLRALPELIATLDRMADNLREAAR